MKKCWIETRHEGGRIGRVPSINVKIGYRKFAPGLTAEMVNCDEDLFEKAKELAFNAEQGFFWDEAAQEIAERHLGANVTVYSAGRSSGHLIVEGLDDVETWNAIPVSAWWRFVRAIEADIAERCDTERTKENILANRWNEEGAEQYNFADLKDGREICFSAMKAEAINAGFGPVVRV
jgi:hypothetical protein